MKVGDSMSLQEQKRYIGEKVQVKNEKNLGVITRVDDERGLVYVQFKRMREVGYPYPEAFEQGYLSMKVSKK